MSTRPLRLGLTGGLCSGKSTVAELLARREVSIIDADAISRDTTAVGGSAIEAIRQSFGPSFIAPDGSLDRDVMRALAFSDASARTRLEAIVHPLVGREIQQQVQLAANKATTCIVFDIPLLVESEYWRREVDKVLVIDCVPEVQIERAIDRSGLSKKTAQAVIASQINRLDRLRGADYVIYNVGLTMNQLADEVNLVPLHLRL